MRGWSSSATRGSSPRSRPAPCSATSSARRPTQLSDQRRGPRASWRPPRVRSVAADDPPAGARSATGSSCSSGCTASAAGSRSSPRRSGAATPTAAIEALARRARGGHAGCRVDVEQTGTDADARARSEAAAVARGCAVIDAARAGDAADALAALGAIQVAVRASPRPVRRQHLDRATAGMARGATSATSTSSSATTSAARCS